ncbi:IclR family transcriptional regulator [Pseudonocardia sp. NPDC049635]|uniref:IclR family transcriptional regulator n=1 Tax=Pseudonocardia sp. NPDC049635 TaxID=3155506 RepID=UPI0033FCA397
MSRTPTGESVLARAVRIFEAFAPGETTLSVSEISRRAGLHISTTSRLVAELTGHGLLARGPGRTVQIGLRLWELGLRASPTLTLRQVALPFLKDLTNLVGHHAQLSVLEGMDILFLERLSAPGAVVNLSRVAGRMPATATAPGVLLLAHADPERQEEALGRPLPTYTRSTIGDPDRLRSALARARRNGFVTSPGWVEHPACGLAVPVRETDGSPVAALSVIVPNDDRVFGFLPALRAAAMEIGLVLRRAHAEPAP